jgi:hypothetical protein
VSCSNTARHRIAEHALVARAPAASEVPAEAAENAVVERFEGDSAPVGPATDVDHARMYPRTVCGEYPATASA